MIPWRDYSFLKDEDDIALLEELNSADEEPVTGKQFYEHTFEESVTPDVSQDMIYFDNFSHDVSTKNHILLFQIILGMFCTTVGLLMIYKPFKITNLSIILAVFGSLNTFFQVTV